MLTISPHPEDTTSWSHDVWTVYVILKSRIHSCFPQQQQQVRYLKYCGSLSQNCSEFPHNSTDSTCIQNSVLCCVVYFVQVASENFSATREQVYVLYGTAIKALHFSAEKHIPRCVCCACTCSCACRVYVTSRTGKKRIGLDRTELTGLESITFILTILTIDYILRQIQDSLPTWVRVKTVWKGLETRQDQVQKHWDQSCLMSQAVKNCDSSVQSSLCCAVFQSRPGCCPGRVSSSVLTCFVSVPCSL